METIGDTIKISVNKKTQEVSVITLGQKYWDAAMRLIDICGQKKTEIPDINIPLLGALILAENAQPPKRIKEDDVYGNLLDSAKSQALTEIKDLLDAFLVVEDKLSYKTEGE